jgi:hypothetical protein
MQKGKPTLRDELQRLTEAPQDADLGWLDVQIREIEALNKQIPHSVRVRTRYSREIYDLNCFMFALGITVSDANEVMACLDKHLMMLLLASHLSKADGEGPIIIYFRDGMPEHAGRWREGTVVSKWGSHCTHIWQHALWDIPTSYGSDAQFFKALPNASELYKSLFR